jgi:YgiT-type zinc finger domain-containing protein
MKSCVICKDGERKPGTATVTFSEGEATVVFERVPAEVCDNCGEEYVDEETADRLLEEAEQAARSGVRVTIRDYAA